MIGSGLHGLIRTKCCVKRKGSPRKSVSVRCKKEKSIMRKISLIIIHCSAVRPDQQSSAAQIDSWHRKDNHWKLGSGLDIRGQPADTRTPEQKAALRHRRPLPASQQPLHRRVLRGWPRHPRSTRRYADARAESSITSATGRPSPPLSACIDRRSSRSEPREGLSMHQGRSP